MRATVYLHPLRTIAMHWETNDGVRYLVGYLEAPAVRPDESIPAEFKEQLCGGATAITIIVHSDNIRFHSFPVDESDEVSERLAFELQEFLPAADRTKDHVSVIPHAGIAYDSAWMSITDIPHRVCENIASVFGSDAEIATDLDCDLRAIAHDGKSIVAGVRGGALWMATVQPSESPYHLERIQLADDADITTSITDAITEHTSTLSQEWNSITVFGDSVTPALIAEIAQSDVGAGRTVKRANAFHLVRARVNSEDQQKVLKRAHLLSAAVGAILE